MAWGTIIDLLYLYTARIGRFYVSGLACLIASYGVTLVIISEIVNNGIGHFPLNNIPRIITSIHLPRSFTSLWLNIYPSHRPSLLIARSS